MDPLEWLKNGLFAVAGAVLVALINAWRKPSSHAELEKAITDAARGIVADLRTEIDRLQGRLEVVETQNAACQGENRQLRQWGESLVSILRREGLSIPERELPGVFVVLEHERATVLKPDPKKPKE